VFTVFVQVHLGRKLTESASRIKVNEKDLLAFNKVSVMHVERRVVSTCRIECIMHAMMWVWLTLLLFSIDRSREWDWCSFALVVDSWNRLDIQVYAW
jgi:hypothetical protein